MRYCIQHLSASNQLHQTQKKISCEPTPPSRATTLSSSTKRTALLHFYPPLLSSSIIHTPNTKHHRSHPIHRTLQLPSTCHTLVVPYPLLHCLSILRPNLPSIPPPPLPTPLPSPTYPNNHPPNLPSTLLGLSQPTGMIKRNSQQRKGKLWDCGADVRSARESIQVHLFLIIVGFINTNV